MYNDGRAGRQAAILNELGAATLSRLGYRFNASFALPKKFSGCSKTSRT